MLFLQHPHDAALKFSMQHLHTRVHCSDPICSRHARRCFSNKCNPKHFVKRSAMLIGFDTGVVTGYLSAWWSGQGSSTLEEPICVDRGVETEGISTTSQSFEFSHAEMTSS